MMALAMGSDVAEGGTLGLQVGDAQVLLCRVGGVVHAVNGVCPHRGAFLAQGTLEGSEIVCPWHAWRFDVTTGDGVTNEMSRLQVLPARESDGRVMVDLPDIG